MLLSVSAVSLRPSFFAGAVATFQATGAVTDETVTVTDGGPITYNAQNAEQINIVTDNLELGGTSTTTMYEAFTSAGFVSYGESSDTTLVSGTGHNETVDSPYLVEIPASLTAGKPLVFTTTSSDTQTINVPNVNPITSTTSNTLTTTIKLVSNAQQTVTVPAGTFKAYEVEETTGTHGTTTTTDLWYAPHVGEVQSITGIGNDQVVEQLTSYTKRPSGLTASLSGTLTDSTVETTPLQGKEKIAFTATGDAVAGIATARVLLSPDTDAADSEFTLSLVVAHLNLKAGQQKVLALHLPKTIPDTVVVFPDPPKTFLVLIELTDTDGVTTTEVSDSTLTVIAPQVNFSGEVVKTPALVVSGKKFSFDADINNLSDANVPAKGVIQITFYKSPDEGSSQYTLVKDVSAHINIKPGGVWKVTADNVMVTSADPFLTVFLDPSMSFNDVDTANNSFGVLLNVTN